MNEKVELCDACKKVIAPKTDSIEFLPVRGGLTIKVNNANGDAGQVVSQAMHFCNVNCFGDFTAAIAAKIPAPQPSAEK